MQNWVKGGLIGFIAVFVGLLILLFIVGHNEGGWICSTLQGTNFCSFFKFITSPLHWAFILFFSWVGFFAGIIDSKIIKKIVRSKDADKRVYLKITSTIMLTLVFVFGFIGVLAFENWVEIMVYAIIFTIFVMILSWVVEKIKYRNYKPLKSNSLLTKPTT